MTIIVAQKHVHEGHEFIMKKKDTKQRREKMCDLSGVVVMSGVAVVRDV